MLIDTSDVAGTQALRKPTALPTASDPLVLPIGRVPATGFEPVRQPSQPIHGYGLPDLTSMQVCRPSARTATTTTRPERNPANAKRGGDRDETEPGAAPPP